MVVYYVPIFIVMDNFIKEPFYLTDSGDNLTGLLLVAILAKTSKTEIQSKYIKRRTERSK